MTQHRTRRTHRRGPLAAAPLLALLLPACGSSGPEMASVSGTVTYEGKPVTKGTISFQPLDPAGRPAVGEIGADGSYALQTENPGDGALLGEYRVAISAREDVILDYIPKKPVPPKLLVPKKYEDPGTSELKAVVKSGRNDIPFDL